MAAKDCDIMFNEVYEASHAASDKDGGGIDIDWACENITVQYNKLYDSYGSGIATMSNIGGKILNNYVYGNQCKTHNGQISLTEYNGDEWGEYPTGVFDNVVSGNLIITDTPTKNAFSLSVYGADTWSGNSFTDNRVVYRGGGEAYYIFMNMRDESVPLAEVDRNKFFYGDGAAFKGQYKVRSYRSFEDWKEATGFDKNSAHLPYDPAAPGAPVNLKASRGRGGVTLTWDAPASGAPVWHYNIYRSENKDDFPLTYYQTMIGESETCKFVDTENIEAGKIYYYKVEAESDCGVTSLAAAEAAAE